MPSCEGDLGGTEQAGASWKMVDVEKSVAQVYTLTSELDAQVVHNDNSSVIVEEAVALYDISMVGTQEEVVQVGHLTGRACSGDRSSCFDEGLDGSGDIGNAVGGSAVVGTADRKGSEGVDARAKDGGYEISRGTV